jgi:hypothetical protein
MKTINGMVMDFNIEAPKLGKFISSLVVDVESLIKVDLTQEIINKCANTDWQSESTAAMVLLDKTFVTMSHMAHDQLEAECYEAMHVYMQKCTLLYMSRLQDPEMLKQQISDAYDALTLALEGIGEPDTVIHVGMEWLDKRVSINLCLSNDDTKFWTGFEVKDAYEFKEAMALISKNISEGSNIFWKLLKKACPPLGKYIETGIAKPFIAKLLLGCGASDVIVM